MNSSVFRICAALLILVPHDGLAADTAPGVLIAAENFDYQAGASLDGTNGGSGWASAWFHAPSITRHNRVDEGGRMLQIGGDVRSFRKIDMDRKEVAGLVVDGEFGKTLGREGTTIWISFRIAIKSWPQVAYGGIHLCDGLGDLAKDPFGDKRAHQRISMGRNNTSPNWYLGRVTNGAPGGGKWESNVRADDHERLLVYRFDYGKSMVAAKLFIDPTPGKEPDAKSAAITADNMGSFHFNTLSVGAGGSAQFLLDEIRIGTSFAVVVPATH